jgi:hypothetical protein
MTDQTGNLVCSKKKIEESKFVCVREIILEKQ